MIASSSVGVSVATAGIGVAHRRFLDGPGGWLLAWVVVDAFASVASTVGAIQYQNAQYVVQAWYPISAALALCLVASAMATEAGRRPLFMLAGVVALTIVGLTLAVEEPGSFAKVTGVIHGMTLLLVGSALVLYRTRKSRGDMFGDQLFIIGAAFILVGAPSPLLAIGVRFTGPDQRELHSLMFALKNLLGALSYLLMIVAFHMAEQRDRQRIARPSP